MTETKPRKKRTKAKPVIADGLFYHPHPQQERGGQPRKGSLRVPRASHTAPLNVAGRHVPPNLIASINVGHASQMRIYSASWRGLETVELRPFSAQVPGMFMPCGAGVTLPLAQLPNVLAALRELLAASPQLNSKDLNNEA
jgi:hypothetical protein